MRSKHDGLRTRAGAWFALAVTIPVTLALGEQTPDAESRTARPTIRFDGEVFVLASADRSDVGTYNEYIPETEKMSSWSRLVGVRHYPKSKRFDRVAASFAKKLERKPEIRGLDGRLMRVVREPAVRSHDEGQRIAVEFVIRDGDRLAEYDLHLFQADASGEGLTIHQFAERAYGEEVPAYLSRIGERAKVLAELVNAFTFPKVVEVP